MVKQNNDTDTAQQARQVDYIYNKIDLLFDKHNITQQQLSAIEKTQNDLKDEQTEMKLDIREHMRRTEIAEEGLALAREEARLFRSDIENRLRPIESESEQKKGAQKAMKTLFWVLGSIVTISSLINAVPKILSFLQIIP